MKNNYKFCGRFAIASLLAFLTACGSKEDSNADPVESVSEEIEVVDSETQLSIETADDKISYILGYETVSRYKDDPILKLNRDVLIRGVEDAISGADMLVSREVASAAGQELQTRLNAQRALEALGAQKESEAYFSENKEKEGIVETESGLQYEILTKGDSEESPLATDSVEVHYHGTLTNGEVFDSSVERGEPISFPLNGVIKGWTEGLQLMSIGDKFRFYIPSDLAYGPQEKGSIPANSILIFDVELLGIN